MKSIFLILGGFFVSYAWANLQVDTLGVIEHGEPKNAITVGYSYDSSARVLCVHAGMTRHGGAAATAIECYSGSGFGNFSLAKHNSVMHPDGNSITVFTVKDVANNKVCYGNAMTRSGNIIYDSQGGKMASAGADISLKCL